MDGLLDHDPYLLLADYAAYAEAHRRAAVAYLDPERWSRMAILNVAHMGPFSSDRTIREYADEIWRTTPVRVEQAPRTNDRSSESPPHPCDQDGLRLGVGGLYLSNACHPSLNHSNT